MQRCCTGVCRASSALVRIIAAAFEVREKGCVCRILRMQATVKDDPMAQEEERMTVVCIRDLSHPTCLSELLLPYG
jgi:hypothetical protein